MMTKELNQVVHIDLLDEAMSLRFAQRLAEYIEPNLVMTFSGNLGVGKTTLIRAMLTSLGVQGAIKSPTFSLVESYSCKNLQIHHFDLYRIHDEEELEYLGFRDYFANQAIYCIEWPEHGGKALPAVDIRFTLEIKGAGRTMHIEALSVAGKRILSNLAGE